MGNCFNKLEHTLDEIDNSIDNLKRFENRFSEKIYKDQDIPGNVSWDDTVPFVPPITEGIVIKVYDGDTITIASRLPIEGSPIYRFSVRLSGIDTPEMRGKTKEERQVAKLAQEKLERLILNRCVTLGDVQTEKYGRVLAVVYCKGTCVNDWMIKKRFAVEYDGGTKQTPKSWKKYLKSGKK